MKKTKLLTPIIAVATLGSVAPIVMLSSCSKNNSNISLDDATQQSSTTSANVTTKTYSFNVANYDENTEEIVPEIEDETSTTDVQVEIVNYYYDTETKKFIVVVSVSKTEGTLTESEEVSFSINFKCHKKESKVEKWIHKIEKFMIKHHIGEEDQHFSDIDTTKIIKTVNKASEETTFSFTPSDTWTETAEEGALKLSNLHVSAVSHFRGFESGIIINPEVKTELKDGQFNVTVSYDTTYAKRYDSFATFGLIFAYYDEANPDTAFVQTTAGFAVQYVESLEQPHVYLFSSRERHYYKTIEDDAQSATNYLCFAINDGVTYQATDFSVTSSSDLVTISDLEIITLETNNYLIVPYSVKKQSKDPYAQEPDLFNVSITIESKQEGNTWTNTTRGINILNVSFLPLVTYDSDAYDAVVFKVGNTTLTDVFTTISPITDLWTGYATIKDVTNQPTLTVDKFSYLAGTEMVLNTTNCGINVGDTKTVTYSFYLNTSFTAFKYSLTKDTKFTQ